MRNLQSFKTYCVVGCISLLLISCGGNKEKPVKNGVDAEILNLTDSTVSFYSALTPLEKIKGREPSFYLDIPVDSNGIFVRPLDLLEGYYYLEYDHNKNLYFVQHGKRLSLDFDATQPTEKPDYSGKLKYESRYLFDRALEQANFLANQNRYYAYDEKQFIESIELLRGKMDTQLVMYISNHPTGSPRFMQQESLTNLYFMASQIEAYPLYRNENSQELSADYFHFTDVLNINDTNASSNPEFYDFIVNYVWNRAGVPTSETNIQQQITFVDSNFTVNEYKDYLRFTAAKEVTQWKNESQRKIALDTLIGLINDTEIRQFLVKNVEKDTAAIPTMEHVILEDQ
tara:strand:- start:85108 stop:86136 length:1029 start_codon:yes stop_codon:yes gene_type:complete